MLCYLLEVLRLAVIKELLVITTPEDLSSYQDLFSDGFELSSQFSMYTMSCAYDNGVCVCKWSAAWR